MTNQLVAAAVGELVQVLLQVSTGHLAAGAYGEGDHLLGHAGRLELEQVRAVLVDAGDQQAHTVGALSVVLGVDLSLRPDQIDQGPHGHAAAVGQAVAQALLLHEIGEHTRIRCEACNGDSDMLVDGEELFLVGREFFGIALVWGSGSAGVYAIEGWVEEGQGGAAGTLIATSTACVLLAMPTTTEPCFTASAAYSTWNIRPCGELCRGVSENGENERPRQGRAYNVTESLS